MTKLENYHTRQYQTIYDSTLEFIKFIKKNVSLKKKIILDIDCGGGANTIYLAKQNPTSVVIGVDYNKKLIEFASNKVKEDRIENCKFIFSSIEKLSLKKLGVSKIDLCISFHFLSFTKKWILNNIEKIISLKPKYLAHSSLFYNGEVDAKILIDDFSRSEFQGSNYNVYSIPKIKDYLKKKNFSNFKYSQMKVNNNLKKPDHSGMQSYTLNLRNNKKMLFSGPLYLPHGFFFSSRN